MPKLINVGFGNLIVAERVVAIVAADSAPVKRAIQDARDEGRLIDATFGRKTRAVIITDAQHVVLSAVQGETIARRMDGGFKINMGEDEAEDGE